MNDLKNELVKAVLDSDADEAVLRGLLCELTGHIKGSSGKCSRCGKSL